MKGYNNIGVGVGWIFSPECLQALLQSAQQAVQAGQQKTGLDSMRSTLVLLVLRKNEALWLHHGDSRLYHIREGEILSLTHDHSVPTLALAAEEISFDEIRTHPDRNKLLRSIGGKNNESNATVKKKPVAIQENDLFLLCSDGFWEYVLEEDILTRWSGDVQTWLQSMESCIIKNAKSDHDNYTACGIHICKN